MSMRIVDTRKLNTLLSNRIRNDMTLVDVRPPIQFRQMHIPGAVNLACSCNPGFADAVLKISGSRNSLVVLYGEDEECPEASDAYQILRQYGFRSVFLYEDGLQGWERHEGYVKSA